MEELIELIDISALKVSPVFSGNLVSFSHYSSGMYVISVEQGSLQLTNERSETAEVAYPMTLVVNFPCGFVVKPLGDNSTRLKILRLHNSNPVIQHLMDKTPDLIMVSATQECEFAHTIESLFNEVLGGGFEQKYVVDCLTKIYLVQLIRFCLNRGFLHQDILTVLTDKSLREVILQVNKDPAYPWSVPELARVAAMSRSKFAAEFKRYSGQTPNDYVTSVRLLKAQKLLSLNKSVGFVATNVGYEHESALIRVFKKKLGVPPRKWLQQVRSLPASQVSSAQAV